MNAVDKKNFLAGLEVMVDHQLSQVIGVLQNQSDTSLAQPSLTGGWSIAECLEHLISYGQYYQPRLQEQFQKSSTGPGQILFRSGWAGRCFIGMMDPKTPGKRYKAAKRHQPARWRPGHQTVAVFIGQLEELLRLLRQAGDADLQRFRIPVSVAPFLTMNAGDTLHFLIIHNQRHIEQAMRNCS